MLISPSHPVQDLEEVRRIQVPNRWLVHAYYTVSPYAPDGSGRMVVAGADLDAERSEVIILDSEGEVLDRFGNHPIDPPTFFHTGRWQTWSADARYVYYDCGDTRRPRTVRRDIVTGEELAIDAALDGGTPPNGPLLSGLLGLLEEANNPAREVGPVHPIEFTDRRAHGLFEADFDSRAQILRLTVEEILSRHPHRDKLLDEDALVSARLGPDEALTLLTFCVRWNNDGSRFIFFFGNNGTPVYRQEPRLKYVMTMSSDMKELYMALDLGVGKPGGHWSWQPDNKTLIGYGPDPEHPTEACLAEIAYDGTGYRKIADHRSKGHPTVSPTNPHLIVTDHYAPDGRVSLLNKRTGEIVASRAMTLNHGDFPAGRSRYKIDAHPVFHPNGHRLLCNSLPGKNAELVEMAVPTEMVRA